MNNYQIFSHSNRKNSVNSSLSTVKLQRKQFIPDDTISFNKFENGHKTRFSYQEDAKNLKDFFHKQNKNSNIISNNQNNTPLNICFNHSGKQAKYIILQKNQIQDDLMYCCERCAILIASKGFQIQKIKENNVNSKGNQKALLNKRGDKSHPTHDSSFNKQKKKHTTITEKPQIIPYSQQIKKQLQQNWKLIKQHKQENLQKIDSCSHYLDEKLNLLEDYFFTLHQYIERQKNNITKEIMKNKRSLQNLRVETSNFYIDQLEDLKIVKQKLQLKGSYDLKEYQSCLNSIKNDFIAIQPKEILLVLNLREVHALGEEMSNLIYKKQANYQQTDHFCDQNKRNSVAQKEQTKYFGTNKNGQNIGNAMGFGFSGQNSSIRSLQLSFEDQQQQKDQQSNFTLNNYQIKDRAQNSLAEHGSRNTSYNTNLLLTSTQF